MVTQPPADAAPNAIMIVMHSVNTGNGISYSNYVVGTWAGVGGGRGNSRRIGPDGTCLFKYGCSSFIQWKWKGTYWELGFMNAVQSCTASDAPRKCPLGVSFQGWTVSGTLRCCIVGLWSYQHCKSCSADLQWVTVLIAAQQEVMWGLSLLDGVMGGTVINVFRYCSLGRYFELYSKE